MFLPEPKSSGGDWAIAPEGVHQAVCVSVIDLGTQEEIDNFNGGGTIHRHKVQVRWELAHELMPDGNYAGQPFTMSKRYTFSTHEKANFRKDLEAWRGKKFEAADFGPGGFNVTKLLGANCQLNIIHKVKADGKVRADIAGIMPLAKGMQKAHPNMCPFIIGLTPDEFDQDVYDGLSENMKATIAKAPEFQALQQARRAQQVRAAPPPAMKAPPAPATQPQPAKAPILPPAPPSLSEELNDEVPF